SGNSSANSEIWADLDQLRGDFEQQGGSNSLLIRLTSAETERSLSVMREEAKRKKSSDDIVPPKGTFMDSVASDQRLSSQVVGEKEYYKSLTDAGLPIEILGYGVAVIMAVGSAFAATNTMYAAVSRRAKEIGTLRALGFGRGAILRSFMIESVC